MKKLLVILCAVIAVTAVLAGGLSGTPAFAAQENVYTPEHGEYRAITIVNNTTDNQPVGVRFSGYYFGGSGIQVMLDVYSSPQLTLDFFIGSENLSESQRQAKEQIIALFESINQFIQQVDAAANTQYDGEDGLPLSDIYKYNSAVCGDRVEVSRYTYEMLQIAREMYNDTNGAFNPAVYRLVDLWGFSSRIYSNGDFGLPYDRPVTAQQFAENGYPLPEQKYVTAFSQKDFVSFDEQAVELTQQEGKYYVTKNVSPVTVDGVEYQQWLDLGGIAKGYVVDGVKQLLQQQGLERYYIDSGSSSSVYGLGYDGGEMTLSLTDPLAPGAAVFPTTLLSFKVGKSSVSTSGQYVRKYVTDGVEYSHIVDGSTGAPAQTGVKEVLAVVPESQGLWGGKGDCLTTALTVMSRQQLVDFVNGYLADNGITVVVVYETFDGKKEILSNLDEADITKKGEHFDTYAWALKKENGVFVYDSQATFQTQPDEYFVLKIVLACVGGALLVGMVVYHFVVGRKKMLQKVQQARGDKPFKAMDVMVYLGVVLVIIVLFSVFFTEEQSSWKTLEVVDDQSGEQLFFYNVVRNEYKINTANSNGWQIEVQGQADGLIVTFTRVIEGEKHFNTLKITRGATPTAKMTDSLCGFHQDCVYNFGEIDKAGGVIVCSPNRLKVVSA